MSQSPILSRLAQALRRARSGLRGGHLVAVSAVAVMAVVGLAGVRAVERSPSNPVGDGGLRIEVVHPVEPDIVPGSVMDVGELVDGFEGVPPPQAEVLWSHDDWDEGWTETEAAAWPAERLAGARPYEPPPEPGRVSPARVVQRWFGFDAPRRDFQAERDARRARLDALERRAWEARRQDTERHDRQAFERRDFERRDQERRADREDAPRPYDEDYAAAEPMVGFSE